MKSEDKTKDPKKENKSADYYSKDVYNYGSVYGISEQKQTQNSREANDEPVESWGFTNNTD